MPYNNDLPEGIFTGLRAITSQSYTEANVKNGLQFEFGTQVTTLAAGANLDIVFLVAAKPIIIKDRIISFSGAGVTAVLYETPTVSNYGDAGFIANLSRISPKTTTISIWQNPTILAAGTQISAPNATVGSTAQGQSVISTDLTKGAERVLKPSTYYLLRVTNNDSASCKVSVYTTWYEGTPDLPLP